MTARTISISAVALIVFITVVSVALAPLTEGSLLPGAPPLYLFSIVGSLFALGAMFYFLTTRTTAFSGLKQPWVDRHIIFGFLAIAISFTHAAGHMTKAPVMMLLAMVGLLVTGVFGRLFTGRLVALRFAQNTQVFAPIPEESSAPIQAIIEKKGSLLSALSSDTPEGEFSLTLSHWLHHPLTALQYRNLIQKENKLVQAQRETDGWFFPLLQRYWRPLHQVLALLLLIGLLAHGVTFTFFADYVSGSIGQETYWWHIK